MSAECSSSSFNGAENDVDEEDCWGVSVDIGIGGEPKLIADEDDDFDADEIGGETDDMAGVNGVLFEPGE